MNGTQILIYAILAIVAFAVISNLIKGIHPLSGKPLGNLQGDSPQPQKPSGDITELSARDLGKVIAMSLTHAESISTVTPEEAPLVAASKVGAQKYTQEKMLLAAAAQSFVIFKILHSHPLQNDVLSGHREIWQSMSSHGNAGKDIYKAYTERCIGYGHAASNEVHGTISRIALEFAKNLDDGNNRAEALALSVANDIYDSAAMSTLEILKQARLA
jgi:hypothetical protein